MRMWMVNPELLCNLHLIGEHGEYHKFKLAFEKGKSIKGRLTPVVQIEPLSMQDRHDELAKEIVKRGMVHKSPYEMPSLEKYEPEEINSKVDRQKSMRDLCDRCYDCRMRIEGSGLLSPDNDHTKLPKKEIKVLIKEGVLVEVTPEPKSDKKTTGKKVEKSPKKKA